MAVQLTDLTFSYEEGATPTLTDVNLTFAPGSFTLFSGPSGSGKSTLLRIMAGLLPRYGGHLTGVVKGQPPVVAMVFQDPSLQFALDTPRHELEFALENCQVPAAAIPDRVKDALDFCGISALADRQLMTLSGGEQQRVALAIGVALDSPLLLLDEPFASLDSANRTALLNRLVALRKRGKTIVIADHDLAGYRQYDPAVVVFEGAHCRLLPPAEASARLTAADHQPPLTGARLPDPASEQPILKLTNLVLTTPERTLLAVKDFSFFADQVTLLTGESGAGKTTLFKALTKLRTFQGQISYQGRFLNHWHRLPYAKQVALVFQRAANQFLSVTVKEELALSQKQGQNPFFTPAKVTEILRRLKLNHLGDQVVYSLSGGQQKKLQLLVMLMMGQPVLLLDEPFAGLDQASLATVLEIIRESRAAWPQTLLIISHQLTGLNGFIDHHVHLANQALTYQGGANSES